MDAQKAKAALAIAGGERVEEWDSDDSLEADLARCAPGNVMLRHQDGCHGTFGTPNCHCVPEVYQVPRNST